MFKKLSIAGTLTLLVVVSSLFVTLPVMVYLVYKEYRTLEDHAIKDSVSLVRRVCKEYKLKDSNITSASRNRNASEVRHVIGWLALKSGNITLTQVAQYFGRDVSTLSRGVKRIEEKSRDTPFEKKWERLLNTIMQA